MNPSVWSHAIKFLFYGNAFLDTLSSHSVGGCCVEWRRIKPPGCASPWVLFSRQTCNRGEASSLFTMYPPPVLLKIPVWEAIPCRLAIFNRVGRAPPSVQTELPGQTGRPPLARPRPRPRPAAECRRRARGRAGPWPQPPGAGRGGGGSGGGTPPARRLPPALATCLPPRPCCGKPETRARRGPGRVGAPGGLQRAEPRGGSTPPPPESSD